MYNFIFNGHLKQDRVHIISNALNLYKISLMYAENYEVAEDIERMIEYFNEHLKIEEK